jgi:hypothetical protein
VFLRLNADGMGGFNGGDGRRSFVRHSISAAHNRLWRGDRRYIFDEGVNSTHPGPNQTSSIAYTSIVPMGKRSFAVVYNMDKDSHCWAGGSSAAFIIHAKVVLKTRLKTDDELGQTPRQTLLNVLDYGAYGDGIHDDTDAIQSALHFAGLATRGNYAPITHGGDASLQHPTLLFPTGTYLISRTLYPNGGVDGTKPCEKKVHDTNQSCVCPAWLRGESSLLKQINSSADILYNQALWRWKVTGLHFVGGRNHIYVGNNDTDNTFVTVRDCLFANASSAAIRTMGPGWWTGEEGLYNRGTASTQFTIRDSQFYSNEQVLVNWCDYMVVEDVWVEHAGPNGSYGKALFENHDRLLLTRMLGVPEPIAGNDQRWIDNHNHGVIGGTVVARDCRFGGEGGGFTVVVNFASFLCAHAGRSKWATGMPGGYKNCHPPPQFGALPNGTNASTSGMIVIDSCLLDSCGNHDRYANIYLEALPAQIILRNSRGFDFAPRYENPAMQVIRVDPRLDLDGPQLEYAATRPGLLRYDIGSSNVFIPDGGGHHQGHGVIDPGLPQQLWPYMSRVEADGPPTTGIWRTNQIVWARPNASVTALGWRCVSAGKPGMWREIQGLASSGDSTESVITGAERLGQSIEKLFDLRQAGALSEREFSQMKAVVIARYVSLADAAPFKSDDTSAAGSGGDDKQPDIAEGQAPVCGTRITFRLSVSTPPDAAWGARRLDLEVDSFRLEADVVVVEHGSGRFEFSRSHSEPGPSAAGVPLRTGVKTDDSGVSPGPPSPHAPMLPVLKSLSTSSFFVEGGGSPLVVRGSGFATSTAILRVRPASSAAQLVYAATVATNCTVISDTVLHCRAPPGPVLAPGPGQADVCNGWSGVDDGCKLGWSNTVAVEYDFLVDVAIGRRPYLTESKGHLLLRSNASLVGRSGVTVVASLPALASVSGRGFVLAVWRNITLNGSNVLEFPLGGSLPATVNTDLKIVMSAGWMEVASFENASVVKWRRFMRAADCHATASCGAVPVQVDYSRRGLLVGGETFFGSGWFTGTGDNYWSGATEAAHAWETTRVETMLMIRRQASLGDNIMMAYGLDELNATDKLQFLDTCAEYGMKVRTDRL